MYGARTMLTLQRQREEQHWPPTSTARHSPEGEYVDLYDLQVCQHLCAEVEDMKIQLISDVYS